MMAPISTTEGFLELRGRLSSDSDYSWEPS